jgi:hypothetical protein
MTCQTRGLGVASTVGVPLGFWRYQHTAGGGASAELVASTKWLRGRLGWRSVPLERLRLRAAPAQAAWRDQQGVGEVHSVGEVRRPVAAGAAGAKRNSVRCTVARSTSTCLASAQCGARRRRSILSRVVLLFPFRFRCPLCKPFLTSRDADPVWNITKVG